MPSLPHEIEYGTPQHERILHEVRARTDFSFNKMSERHRKWEEVDELYQGFIKETDEQKVRKKRQEQGSPQYLTIHVPYSYAMLLAAHTYWSSVFLSRSPVLQFTGRHGETQMQVQAVEAIMDYQMSIGGMMTPLYVWLLDAGKYGFGVLGNYWAEEVASISQIVEAPVEAYGMEVLGKTKKQRSRQLVQGYVGNKVFNVRPYEFLPDPRVSLNNLQSGEFCGRITFMGWNEMLKREASGTYFNLKALKRLRSEGKLNYTRGSQVNNLPVTDDSGALYTNTSFGKRTFSEIVEMTIELSPEEFGLGESKYPEKWVFSMADNAVICGCAPLGAYHNKFPFSVLSYEVDGYSHTGRGLMEVSKPLNDTMTWLLNSHFYNVRKALNDQIVVDPSRVVMKDAEDGGPGRIIRLKPSAYGTDVRTCISQLAVSDVTGNHLRDMAIVSELIQRATGVNDSIMGMLSPRGRKTATEVRTSSSFGVNRLRTFCEYNSSLGWGPLSQILLQNTQQYYDLDRMFRIAGDLLQGQGSFVKVDPESIAGFFDYVPVDGTLPIDRFAQATLWKEILMGLGQMPMVAANYDIAGIFSWMAQIAGLKNITQFKVQLTPDMQMQAQMAQGGMIPLAKANGGPPAPPQQPTSPIPQ